MKSVVGNALILAAGLALGALAVDGLHAQAKQPVYTIAEIQIKEGEQDAYAKKLLTQSSGIAEKYRWQSIHRCRHVDEDRRRAAALRYSGYYSQIQQHRGC